MNEITTSIRKNQDRKSEGFIALRKGMGYCWSVAVVSNPEFGKKLMGKWIPSIDEDIQWIMKENLKKNRLLECDAKWVEEMNRKIV